MKRFAPYLLLLPLAGIVAWVAASGRKPREDPVELLRALQASAGPALPGPAAARLLERTEPARYDRETLYELIDGAADAYLARGFVSCVASTYTLQAADGTGGGTVEVAAEVHRFGDPAGALAQRDAELPPAAKPVDGVPGSLGDGQVLLALRGADLLKLTGVTPGPACAEALAFLAASWGKEPNR